MKKLNFILALLFLMTGCSNNTEPTITVKDETISDTVEVIEEKIIEEAVEIVKEVVEEKIEEVKEVEKEEVKEERTAPMEIHVYSSEIPWNESAEVVDSEHTTISDAVKNAIEGDTIIVHEGIYREVLKITKDNITIKANEGDYVLVSGSEIVQNFVPESTMPGVYVADVPSNYKETTLPYTQVFANGHYQDMARFPNLEIDDYMAPLEEGGGYSKLVNIYKNKGTTEGSVTFESGTLPDVDLTGAIFRGLTGKNREYVFGEVVSTEGNTISFNGTTKNDWSKADAEIKLGYHDYGFGFVTHKNLIDIPGEWFVEDRKLYIMPEGDIADIKIELQVRQQTLQLNNTENVKLENINFVAGNAQIKGTSGAIIDNCTFRYLQPFYVITGYGMGDSAQTGIYIEYGKNNTFRDTYVGHTWGTGIHAVGGEGNSFYNCIFEDMGWIGTFTAGIYSSADNTHIENCSFKDHGRFQVRVDKDIKIDILHSSFERAMEMGEDAGPFEFTSTGKIAPLNLKGSEFAYNKVFDLHGVPVSSGNYNKQFVVAFYMEDVNNYTAHHNLAYDITADSYEGPEKVLRDSRLLYIGPRYNAMNDPVNFYNNTAWDYGSSIGIWNIQIANHEELKAQGLKQEEHTGVMTDGHFVNNLFDEGDFSINYSAQNLTMSGGSKGWAKIPENDWKSISTNDMNEFFEHAAKVDYFFNPQTNMVFDIETGASNYVDAENGDFRLVDTSPAKGAGTPIDGITSSDTPDLGALEGSDYVLSAGSTLILPEFKEIRY
ncbi:hypothetical protein AN641_07385 [Candidatus Epulonipiscioides gigas]|nr:hypothetical protein AN641_07385 [Epulopiscium sp. SCG-C07WGA-EpuloA2]